MQEATVDPERELRTYFAVQLKPDESPHRAAEDVIRTGKILGILFRRLEVIDTIKIGPTEYIRVRSDLLNPFPILEALLSKGRNVVRCSSEGGYELHRPGGRVGKVSTMMMHSTAKPGQTRMYYGPKIKRWEAQFE